MEDRLREFQLLSLEKRKLVRSSSLKYLKEAHKKSGEGLLEAHEGQGVMAFN